MSTRRLLPGKMYTPVGGVNFDSNSLTVGERECASIQNLRVSPNEVRTRGGSRRIASNLPSGDPILHFHSYKAPNGNEVLFAFSRNAIYKFNSSTSEWESCLGTTLIDTCEVLTGWSTGLTSVALATSPKYSGTYSISALKLSATIPSGTILFQKSGTGVMDWDLSDSTMLGFWITWRTQFSGTLSIKVKLYSDESASVVLESHDVTLSTVSTPGAYEPISQVIVPLTDPSLLDSVKSFTIETNIETGGSVNAWALDYIYAFTGLTSPVEFWSTCDFIDDTEKSTVIAAGSKPPSPTEPEDDGASRVLLYYDDSAGYFKTLVQRTTLQLEVTATATTDGSGNCSGTIGTIGLGLVPFGFTLAVGGKLLLDNGNGALTGVNPGDGTGTVNYTTGAWTAQFVGESSAGPVLANYLYYSSVTQKPRFVANFANTLVMANMWDGTDYSPWQVRWTDVADMLTTRGTYYVDLIDTDISPVVGLAYIGEYLIIYKSSSVHKCRYVGGDQMFSFYTAWQFGLLAGRTVCEWNNINFFLGFDDVYLYDGNQFRGIASQRVRNHIFQRMNRSKINNFFTSFDELNKEFWLWIVPSGETYPTDVYVYNVLYNTWSFFKFAPVTCTGRYYTTQGSTIDGLLGTIDQQNWSMEAGLVEGTLRNQIIALADGDVFALDERLSEDYVDTVAGTSTAISWHLVTLDFFFADLGRKDRLSRVHFEASGSNVTVGYATSYKTDLAGFANRTLVPLGVDNLERQYWPDVVHELVRLSFEGTGYFALRWVQPYVITQEKD